jgi:SEC-C motif
VRWQWRAPHPVIKSGDSDRRPSCHASIILSTSPAFEVSSKRRKGYPSETSVKRGLRFVRGGAVELVEKLGRNDPCPCGSGKRFQGVLPIIGPVSMGWSGMTIGGSEGELEGPPIPSWRSWCENNTTTGCLERVWFGSRKDRQVAKRVHQPVKLDGPVRFKKECHLRDQSQTPLIS